MLLQQPSDTRDFGSSEFIVLSQKDRSPRTTQQEHSFCVVADDVHVRRTVIVRINHYSQSDEAQDSRHLNYNLSA